jgi:hypothetical protein
MIAKYADGYNAVIKALEGFPQESLTARPLPGKWSAREIVQHLADSEMTSAIRLRRLLVEDNPVIHGYDQELFATRLYYNDREVAPALDAFRAARTTSLQLLELMNEEDWRREGSHSESGRYTAEDWLSIYAEHAHGHAAQIRRLREALSERGYLSRPEATEYASYYGKYISLVPGDDVQTALGKQIEGTLALLRGLSESQGESRYAPGKWSVKEVIGHLIDAERIFAYRALRIARNDQTPLAGFNENNYVAQSDYHSRKLADLADEFEVVRKANLYLLRNLDDNSWTRRGVASDYEVSVRAIAYIIAGHELHHLEIIRSRYL